MIEKLVLRYFRNYKEATIPFHSQVNLIHGPNGAGKTTILEALYLLSTGRSFKTNNLANLIQKGASHFYIEAHFLKNSTTHTLSMGFDGNIRKMYYNDTLLSTLSDILGIMPSVLFAPKDSELIMGSPTERRRFLNIQLAQQDSKYTYHLVRYHRAMKQRNTLLKSFSYETIDHWEHIMACSAHYLTEKRRALINKLKPKANLYSHSLSLSEDTFDLHFAPSIEQNDIQSTQDILKKLRPKESVLGNTLVGPHRDDFHIIFHDKKAKIYASEGQKRTCITAIKMAEWHQLRERIGFSPLLSIDDFGIHLDNRRIKGLFDNLKHLGQIFLTSPFDLEIETHKLNIKNGQIS